MPSQWPEKVTLTTVLPKEQELGKAISMGEKLRLMAMPMVEPALL